MSAGRDDTLRQFCDVTGADETRSRFFLESSNWQLDVALSSFYEHGGNIEEPALAAAAPTAPVHTLSDSDMDSPPGSPVKEPKKDKKKATNTKFATLDSLQQEASSSDEEEDTMYGWITNQMKFIVQEVFCSDPTCSKKLFKQQSPETSKSIPDIESSSMTDKDIEINLLKNEVSRLLKENSELRTELARLRDDDNGQAFYAGGSERSGQQILGPGKGRKDIVSEMFKSVRERGAVVFDDETSTASRGGRSGGFSGVGYRLGQTADDHEQVTPTDGNAQAQSRSVRLRLYREGFTVDAGPIRPYADPDNAHFLNCIRRGEIPPELGSGGGEVRVSLEDRRHEECPRQTSAASQRAFSGKGHLLGSPTPPTVGATSPAVTDASDRAANLKAAQTALNVDETKPTTNIQFRLADGSRLTGRFNHSHTVSDLSTFICRAEPAYQLQPFMLLAGFPNAELKDPSQTLSEANLLNSTVLQRFK